ncbi:MAG: dTDP-glucose 4,6-dehydratase [Syntrophorhabdus sp. PtaB.Bin047]|nr:MAG: dTDP-glucose 4,6-dehydratase [Syntrophorhabdus sp. PtaB.Bin047]
MAERILVTGGCGFIGTNFVRHMLERYDYNIINLDKLTYAGNLENLEDVSADGRYTFVRGDIASSADVEGVFESSIDVVVNFAAESHVDRSIMDPDAFIRTNIYGTFNLLEAARRKGVGRFVQISTDEVYGSLGESGAFREDTPLSPNSPYSASKTSADILAMAYFKTYGMPVVITRCSNNYGPYQFPEKLIPLMITNALADKELPVYGDGLNVRDWIHVKDHCAAIDLVVHRGEEGNVYNIGASNERANIEIVELVLDILGKPRSLIRYVKDRPGHDRRYAIDSGKITDQLGYRPSVDFSEGMRGTVDWYVKNKGWWERIKTGAYLDYYEKMYGNR